MPNINIKKAKTLQELTSTYRGVQKVKGSIKDFIIVYQDFCRNDGNYTKSKNTRLYQKHSAEYCSLLEVLSRFFADHQIA